MLRWRRRGCSLISGRRVFILDGDVRFDATVLDFGKEVEGVSLGSGHIGHEVGVFMRILRGWGVGFVNRIQRMYSAFTMYFKQGLI